MISRAKLWPGLSLEALSEPEGQLNLIVSYRPSVERTQRVQEMNASGEMTVLANYRILPLMAVRVSASGLYQLEQDPAVERIWPDLPVRALLDKSVPLVHAPSVWLDGYTGKDMRIGIVDTGVDTNHPDLAGRVVQSADFTGEGPRDANGHGTHVAGIAAGSGAASGGRYRGVAPEANIYAAKVLGANGGGATSTVIAGLEWAAQQSVHVINLSLGSSTSSDGTDALSEACNTLMARGYVICAAAGNEGPYAYTVGAPGAASQVITVGACTLDQTVADFSSRGPTRDGRVKPDILCPGANIVSCRAAGTEMGSPIDDHYTVASGTSMATPFATGMVALLVQAFPQLRAPEIKERIKRSAIDLKLSPYEQGTGQADALRAYQNEQGTTEPIVEPTPPPLPQTGCITAGVEFLRDFLK
jgi:serine protease AprX